MLREENKKLQSKVKTLDDEVGKHAQLKEEAERKCSQLEKELKETRRSSEERLASLKQMAARVDGLKDKLSEERRVRRIQRRKELDDGRSAPPALPSSQRSNFSLFWV